MQATTGTPLSDESDPAAGQTGDRRRSLLEVWVGVAVLAYVLDQVTKWWAQRNLTVGVPRPLVGDLATARPHAQRRRRVQRRDRLHRLPHRRRARRRGRLSAARRAGSAAPAGRWRSGSCSAEPSAMSPTGWSGRRARCAATWSTSCSSRTGRSSTSLTPPSASPPCIVVVLSVRGIRFDGSRDGLSTAVTAPNRHPSRDGARAGCAGSASTSLSPACSVSRARWPRSWSPGDRCCSTARSRPSPSGSSRAAGSRSPCRTGAAPGRSCRRPPPD